MLLGSSSWQGGTLARKEAIALGSYNWDHHIVTGAAKKKLEGTFINAFQGHATIRSEGVTIRLC